MEILYIVIMFLLLIVPSVIFKRYWLATVFVVFGVCFGLIEWVCHEVTGESVSQLFWEWSKENKKEAWIILGCMLVSWLMLLVHLGKELIKKKEKVKEEQ